MSAGTKIQWADDTANFWRGCTKVSPGCLNCYAEKNIGVKMNGIKWGKGAPRVLSQSAFNEALKWNRSPLVCGDCGKTWRKTQLSVIGAPCPTFECKGTLHRRRVFSLSLGDWLDEEVPITWLARMLETIHECQHLNFLLLTKRPENFVTRISRIALEFDGPVSVFAAQWLNGYEQSMPKNAWVGVSVENQAMADKRIPELLKIPAVVRFLSIEPLLGPVDLTDITDKDRFPGCASFDVLSGKMIHHDDDMRWTPDGKIDWIIIGGESGSKARDCDVRWIESLVEQGKAAGVPTFVKQLGSRPYQSPRNDGTTGFYLSLKDKKGGDISEWPADLRARQFPKAKILTTDGHR